MFASTNLILLLFFFYPIHTRDLINDLYTEVFEAGPQARVIELLIRYYENVFEDPAELYFGTDGAESGKVTDEARSAPGGVTQTQQLQGQQGVGGGEFSSTQFPLSPPLSPTPNLSSMQNPMSSDSNLFSNSSSNPTASIGSSLCRPISSRVTAAARHNQVRRTSSSSSASPSPGATCNAAHHHHNPQYAQNKKSNTNPLSSSSQGEGAPTSPHPPHHHCPLSSSASTFTFD